MVEVPQSLEQETFLVLSLLLEQVAKRTPPLALEQETGMHVGKVWRKQHFGLLAEVTVGVFVFELTVQVEKNSAVVNEHLFLSDFDWFLAFEAVFGGEKETLLMGGKKGLCFVQIVLAENDSDLAEEPDLLVLLAEPIDAEVLVAHDGIPLAQKLHLGYQVQRLYLEHLLINGFNEEMFFSSGSLRKEIGPFDMLLQKLSRLHLQQVGQQIFQRGELFFPIQLLKHGLERSSSLIKFLPEEATETRSDEASILLGNCADLFQTVAEFLQEFHYFD